MPVISAGLLIFRQRAEGPQFLLAHPGGPFWQYKDLGTWGIPKGQVNPGEDLLDCAKRECEEEIGYGPEGKFIPLRAVKLSGGKVVHAWAIEGDFDTAHLKSNAFTMEWPPKSGKFAEFPEVDRAEFFSESTAKAKITPRQRPLLDELVGLLRRNPGDIF